ncbi:hypothetical protein M3Y99_01725700 [Aphelenchoides fujianensis]|nr:hypothetical protein M3Y99_01725700 [Aphelenchoides fujianensis]
MLVDPHWRSNKKVRAPEPPQPAAAFHATVGHRPPSFPQAAHSVDFSRPVFLQSAPITPPPTVATPIRNNNKKVKVGPKTSTPKKEFACQRPTTLPPPPPVFAPLSSIPPPPPPPPAPLVKLRPPESLATVPAGRSDLMAAIRAAGGTSHAGLKKVDAPEKRRPLSNRSDYSAPLAVPPPVKTQSVVSERGDFMNSLTQVLQKRRKEVEAATATGESDR